MAVKHHVSRRIRRRRTLTLLRRAFPSHLHRMIVIMIAVGVRVNRCGWHARRKHRNQQQQPGQLPDGALDQEVYAMAEYSKRHF